MAVVLNPGQNPELFAGRHNMFVPIERVTQPPNPPTTPYRGFVVLSGVAIINFKGNSVSQWRRERFQLWLNDDLRAAIGKAPWAAPPGTSWWFHVEQWAPFATVNARHNLQVANNDGSAADSFGLDAARGAVLNVDVAVRDTDAVILRLGYELNLYGRLEAVPVIP